MIILAFVLLSSNLLQPGSGAVRELLKTEANVPIEITFSASRPHPEPFSRVDLNVTFTDPMGGTKTVPAFWAGGNRWKARYASPLVGKHSFHSTCNEKDDTGLHGITGAVEIRRYTGKNPLYLHGPLRITQDHRRFEHIDGTPFFWLGDTWWKGLCKRITWEGFQQLTADRKAKGFSVVQIVCGPYPDEGPFEARWENEAGKPYETRDFSRVNPAYFELADRRIQQLIDAGIVPAIVGGWGRPDCDAIKLAGVDGMERHWRHLVARYGAYPAIWIIGGESEGPQWTRIARFVRKTDPFHHLTTIHPNSSARGSVPDESVLDFDMLQTGHGDWNAAIGAIPKIRAAVDRRPQMPSLIGEYCYEGHMQTAFQDVQRYVFWASMLSGSAGVTYGAAGVWNAGVEGDPGLANAYDWTTWQEGMNYPGSGQLGRGKKLLEKYPWWRFERHSEWAPADAFAAGIPGEVRFIYIPKRGVYDWGGPVIHNLEPNVPYHAVFFDPATERQFDAGEVINPGSASTPMTRHELPLLFEDGFDGPDTSAWKDYGTPTKRERGRLVGGKGMETVLDRISGLDLMASVEANSKAEAGIILRYHDRQNYLVALYSPLFKTIYIHDRRNGEWGEMLGKVSVPDIGPRMRLTAACTGKYAALMLTDGSHTYVTPTVTVTNTSPGKTGLWLYQFGDRQEYGKFALSSTHLAEPMKGPDGREVSLAWSGDFHAPNLPSPQDWVLVLERVKR